MTGPVITEALVEALIAGLDATEHCTREGQAAELIAGPLAPILAALQRVTAERDEAREVVARCNNSFGSYSYHLNPHPAEQIEKVKWQARSEWQRAETAEVALATANAEIARRRAEGEAKDRALKPFASCAEVFGGSDDAPVYCRQSCPTWGLTSLDLLKVGDFRAARAATAREGQAHTPAGGALKIEEADRA